jgi:hypothetical protein
MFIYKNLGDVYGSGILTSGYSVALEGPIINDLTTPV